MMDVITDSWWDWSYTMLVKEAPGWDALLTKSFQLIQIVHRIIKLLRENVKIK